jgi:hypothetical protein
MNTESMKSTTLWLAIIMTLVSLLLVSGCARYAHNSDTLYEPSTPVRGGSGEVYIVIPESQQTQSPNIKHVLGKISDGSNRKLDDVYSSRSGAEIIQAALGLELKRAGYIFIPVTKRPATEQRIIDLTITKVKLDQISELTNVKVTCQVVMGMDVYKAGQLAKRLQYEATSSRTDIKDRDMLAGKVLQEALQSAMLQAIPDLHNLFSR